MTLGLRSTNRETPMLRSSRLAQLERLARYRELAGEAGRLAKASPKERQHCYLLAAEWWRELATDLENHLARESKADGRGQSWAPAMMADAAEPAPSADGPSQGWS